MGYPELGYVDLQELADLKTSCGSPVVERDLHFNAKHPISVYADAARFWEYITNLLSNIVMAWNTVYLQEILK